jgi:hypothetical protein
MGSVLAEVVMVNLWAKNETLSLHSSDNIVTVVVGTKKTSI